MNNNFFFASQFKRILARLIDLFIFLIFIFLIFNIKILEWKKFNINFGYFLNLLIVFLFFFIFQIFLPFLNNGKTFGKYIFKIKIINRNNKKLSIFFFIFREFFIFLPIFFVLFLSIIFKEKIDLFKENDIKETSFFYTIMTTFIKIISLFIIFWFVFIFIFQKINPSKRLFYDKYWDSLVIKDIKIIKNNDNINKYIEIKKEKKIKNMEFSLNNSQIKAIEISKKKNLRIIAGPGTGKTTVLASRILNFIKNEYIEQEKILVLTFTKKASKNIKNYIQYKIPDYKGEQVFTYHGFCYKFLVQEKHFLDFGENKNFKVLDTQDQKQVLRKIIRKKDDSISITEMNDIFKILTNKSIYSIEEFEDFKNFLNINEKFINEKRIFLLWDLKNEYIKYKKDNFLFDFDDLLFETYNLLLKNDSLLKKWRNRYSQILIDEFQDTNKIQYNLIKLLSRNGEDIKVTVVGDPDQTIYCWRDAKIDFILNFHENFKDTITVILDKNYRSTQNIINVSNFFIKKNEDRVVKNILSTKSKGEFVELFIEEEYLQVFKIVEEINILKQKGIENNKIVIVYRSNYLSGKLEKELINKKINYFIYKGTMFFSRREIKDLLILISFLIEESDFEIERILTWVKGISIKIVDKMKSQALEENISLYEFVKQINEKPKFIRFSSKINEMFSEIFFLKETLNENKSFYILTKLIFKKIFLPILEQNFLLLENKIKNIKTLFEIIKQFELSNDSLTIKEKIFEFLNEINISTSEDFLEVKDEVRLMTIHQTKGLEFDYVFIFNISDKIFFPKKKYFEDFDDVSESEIEESRRVLYVAMTRAKKKLFITSEDDSLFKDELKRNEKVFIKI